MPTSKDVGGLPSVEDTIDIAREDAEARVPAAVTTPKEAGAVERSRPELTDVKVLLRSDQEVPLTLILREVQARRQQRTLVERSPVESHATVGAIERANWTLGEMLRTMKHATETRVGGKLGTDHLLISCMIRHCYWIFCKYHVRADGRTSFEVLRNNSYRGGLACFGEIVGVRVPGTRLLRGKFEVNWLELVWLGKTENTEEHLGGDEHGVRKFWTIRRQPESARWRREYVDKLTGDPFNPGRDKRYSRTRFVRSHSQRLNRVLPLFHAVSISLVLAVLFMPLRCETTRG